MNNDEKGGHHIRISGYELQGIDNYQAKALVHSALAYLWDGGKAQLPDVKKHSTQQ
jgi:hypothetical protein